MHGTHSWRASYYQTHSSERQRGVPSLLISFCFFKGVSRKTQHQQPRIHLTNPKTQSQGTQTATAAECARCCARLAAQQRLHHAHGGETGSQGDAADNLLNAVHSSLSNMSPSWPAPLTNTGLLTHRQANANLVVCSLCSFPAHFSFLHDLEDPEREQQHGQISGTYPVVLGALGTSTGRKPTSAVKIMDTAALPDLCPAPSGPQERRFSHYVYCRQARFISLKIILKGRGEEGGIIDADTPELQQSPGREQKVPQPDSAGPKKARGTSVGLNNQHHTWKIRPNTFLARFCCRGTDSHTSSRISCCPSQLQGILPHAAPNHPSPRRGLTPTSAPLRAVTPYSRISIIIPVTFIPA